ncbi:hypothetical protein TNIN_122191 [Trichonephila inaurata madagascariensis]|uniref:Uncharacterized protein n=1 Tax=Trichonephila inaurata madagascariensis TaxID=2747483 RepID=A0A8X6YUN3_9ARAC|nr:hypothetical protein TNIN_122191 [Trichonephila inaurata madagascariensis]
MRVRELSPPTNSLLTLSKQLINRYELKKLLLIHTTFVIIFEVWREVQSDDHKQNGDDDNGSADGHHYAGRFAPFLLDFSKFEPGLYILLPLPMPSSIPAIA